MELNKDSIEKEYNSGKSMQQIANELGLKVGKIRYFCKKSNIKARKLYSPEFWKVSSESHKKLWQKNGKMSYRVGENAPAWKGGRKITDGYVFLFKPNHPKADCNGYISEHRFVMSQIIGRWLESWEQVHHKNGIKTDNKPENLELVFRKNHFGNVRCPHCLKDFLIK